MDFLESVMWNNLPLPLFMRGSNWTLGIAAVTDANFGWVSRFRPLFPDELAQIGNERGRSCPSLSATYLYWYLILIFALIFTLCTMFTSFFVIKQRWQSWQATLKRNQMKLVFRETRQSKHCGFSIYIFDNSKSKSMVRLVRRRWSCLVWSLLER